MPSRTLHTVASARPAMVRAQMSRPNGFARLPSAGGRGRAVPLRGAVARAPGDVTKPEFLAWWSGLMLRRCGSARAVADQFKTTEQTGRNWIDGVACPTGLQVMRAMEWWRDDFAAAGPALRSAGRRAA